MRYAKKRALVGYAQNYDKVAFVEWRSLLNLLAWPKKREGTGRK